MQPSPIIKSLHVYSPLPNAEAGDIGRPDVVGGGCDSEAAVSLATRLENLVNLLGSPFIRQGPLGWPRFEAPVVTAARETQRLGHPLYSEFGSMSFHKFVFSARGTEKMSTTCFNISRSSPTTASARRSLANAASNGRNLPFPGKASRTWCVFLGSGSINSVEDDHGFRLKMIRDVAESCSVFDHFRNESSMCRKGRGILSSTEVARQGLTGSLLTPIWSRR